jgi:hypothetical protein
MGKTFKQDKGIAGLTILLSLIVMLFVIGLLVMIFTIMGSKMQDSTYDSTTLISTNETLAKPTTAGITLAVGDAKRNGVCGAVTKILNGTTFENIALGNISQTGCVVKNATSWAGYTANVLYTYPYTYDADNSATDVMNDTTSSVAGVTEWFDIFIVIGAMVVLILLTVVIITAIRSSGMVAGGEQQGANQVGTA